MNVKHKKLSFNSRIHPSIHPLCKDILFIYLLILLFYFEIPFIFEILIHFQESLVGVILRVSNRGEDATIKCMSLQVNLTVRRVFYFWRQSDGSLFDNVLRKR